MGRKLRHLLIFLLIILKEPNLQITMIHEGAFVNLPQLQYLNLENNQITKIQEGTFVNVSQLQTLSLGANRITNIKEDVIAYLPGPGLQDLHLYINQITKIEPGTFTNLPRLRTLSLRRNEISKIHACAFANLPRLLRLNLDNNRITMIPKGAFANLPRLRRLYLDSNRITTLQPGAFVNLSQLQELDLSSNKMSAITPLAFSLLPSNLFIRLNGNPWQCDCRMAPLRLDSTEFSSSKDTIVCVEPANLWEQKLAYVSPEDLVCAEPTMSALPVDVQVTFNNCYEGTTAGSTSNDYYNSTTAGSTSDDYYNSTTAGSTSNDYYNSTTAGLKGSTTGATEIPTLQTTSDIPESDSSIESDPSFPIPVLIGSNCGSIAGIALIGTVILTIWCKRRTNNSSLDPTLGPNSNIDLSNLNMTIQSQTINGQSQTITDPNPNTTTAVVTSAHDHQYEDIDQHNNLRQGQSQTNTEPNTNTTAAGLMTSDHDHQYDDVDNHHDQAGQGQSLANAQSLKVENLSHHELVAALDPNPMYVGVEASAKGPTSTAIASGHNQTGQGQSHAMAESLANTTVGVVSGHDHQYEDMTQHNQTRRGQSQAIAESNANTTAGSIVTSGHDHQCEDVDNHHDQTDQGQSQASNESLDARNLSYGTGPTASQQNSLYKVVGQYQALIQHNSNTTAGVVTSGHDQYKDMTQHDQTGKGQSQVITESNPNTTARVMSSCHDHKYEDMNQHNHLGQGQFQTTIQSLNVENLSHNEVLAALKPNPMYAAVETQSRDQKSAVMTGGHDQTGQGQSHVIAKSLPNTVAAEVSGHDHQYEDMTQHNQAGQGQSHVIAKSLPNTTASVVSGHEHHYEDMTQHNQTGQGQSQANPQSPKIENLSHDEVLASLKPNPMYAGVGTLPKDQNSS
uniref:LRRCT domain-containing protein n=1 Tax=Branchiostoma floridae TaxID=7739 RepID=C3XWU7_BRAFL|eukprot:XP_002611197.1 hypothetical protein BRAFLDRAFT_71157 [Branchiostoma floridae]